MLRRFEIQEAFSAFWRRNPALFYSCALLLGTAVSFCKHPLFFFLIAILCLSSELKRTRIIALLCFFGVFFATSHRYPKINLPIEKVQGKGILHIDQVKVQTSPFNKSILYKGTLLCFETEEKMIYRDLPCHIYLPLFSKRPPANTDYELTGTLCQKGDYFFILKPDKRKLWNPIPSFFNLAEWRFKAKQSVAHYLKKEIANPQARSFLNALSTGDIEERILSLEFGKVGLQHILAISGFHFVLAALFLNFILRLFCTYRISAGLLVVLLTCYYLFLGNAPSIQRAYIAISLVAIGHVFSIRTSGLNALGTGLIIELLFDPLVVTQLSFQLTFLCTLGILLFYPLLHKLLMFLLPERSYSEVERMSLLDKHGYLFSALLRRAFALNFSVHLISLPVLLFSFHKFPLLSLAYNLFFPACVSLSLLLLFTAFFFAPWLPVFSHAIHAFNNAWTSTFLTLTSNPPAFLDFSLRVKSIPFSFVLSFLAFSFFLGIVFHEKQRMENKFL